ncbi:MAG: mechanosensitive ion channel domain-containing protein [Candidatus Omnitrophota bacterium]
MKGVSKNISFEVAKKAFLPFSLLALFLASYIFYKFKISPRISEHLRHELVKYIGSLLIVFVAFFLQRVIGAVAIWYQENVAMKTLTRLDDELIPLIRRALKTILWIVALLVILPFYGVNINALIATLGVGSLAIALAAQDTIANIIAGFLIMIDRPFRIGDKIKLPSGEIARVLEIGIRRSKFQGDEKGIIIVPNLDLSKSKIVNYTYGEEKET